MFKTFKTQGLNLENTHITDTEKLDRLIAVVAVAFYWAYKAGVVKDATIEPIKVIAKTGKPLYSVFKYGFDYLQESLQQADIQMTCLPKPTNTKKIGKIALWGQGLSSNYIFTPS